MSDLPVVTVLARTAGRSRSYHGQHPAPSTSVAPAPLAFGGVEAVEIVAPDQHCAALLLAYAAPLFPAKLVPGPPWLVRFQPPPSGGEWVVDLLAVVERWLASAPIPCAKMRRGGRSYLIRGPLDAA